VDRLSGETGDCGVGDGAVVHTAVPHFGEEPEIAGRNGSGAVFFGSCNLRCTYCQNAKISQSASVRRMRPDTAGSIARKMIELSEQGCHNINWVSPAHVSPFAMEGLAAAGDLGLPMAYNTNAYESVDTLKLLHGIVDVYLPDLRYSDDETAERLSGAEEYVETSRSAIVEMARQVGAANSHAADGTIERGIIVRLLVLPNDLSGIEESLAFLRDSLGTGVRVALMSQYFPAHLACDDPLLSRPLHYGEYNRALESADRMGFDNVLVQEMDSPDFYRPDFDDGERPFRDIAEFRKGNP